MSPCKLLLLPVMFVLTQIAAHSENTKIDPIKAIVNEMAAHDIYERSTGVGYAGTASKQLQLFEKLRSLASENELTELAVNNKNAVVRLYALQALKTKHKNCRSKCA